MGCGSWTASAFKDYSVIRGRDVSLDGSIYGDLSNQEMFKAKNIDPALDPKNVIRECCDTEQHPNTIPVVLALDVTGSMGAVAVEIAKKINVIMTKLYESIPDVEFMIMGIGDLAYDYAPIQASQFESDIRIAEQLDKIFFEFGGGGNEYESYTAAWYFASRHTKLDCLNRGRKGIIITMGDEKLNPYLPASRLSQVTGDGLQANIETDELYKEVSRNFNVYHLHVDHMSGWGNYGIIESYKHYLDDDHVKTVSMNDIPDAITDIIINEANNGAVENSPNNSTGITW